MRYRLILALMLGIDLAVLLFEASGLSLSYDEARIFFYEQTPLHYLVSFSVALFGQNDIAPRLPMIAMHAISVLLLFAISRPYLPRTRDRLWLVLIFILLPGVSSSALVVNEAGMIIVMLFASVYAIEHLGRWQYLVLGVLPMLDVAGAFLYLGLFLYALDNKAYNRMLFSAGMFAVSIFYYGYMLYGVPKGYFLDALGVYAAIFSPPVFLYLVYTLYRKSVVGERSMLWYLSASVFVYTLLISFRQRVELQIFAPFLMLALPLAAQTFFHSYRIRLKEFRNRYKLLFFTAFGLLLLNVGVVMMNKYLYLFLENPKRHFAYDMHIASELSGALKARGVECADAQDSRMQLRLEYYGITHCNDTVLKESALEPNANAVTISYNGVEVYNTDVTKILKK